MKNDSPLPFSPDLVPLMSHPLVRDRGPDVGYLILAQKLFSWLFWTQRLEVDAVIPTCSHLMFDRLPFLVPHLLRRDANKILVDEAYHAECAGDLIDQMVELTGV